MRRWLPAIAAVGAGLMGFALWRVTDLLTSTREPWDSLLWPLGILPLMALSVGLLAYALPVGAWRWAVAATLGHYLGQVVQAQADNWTSQLPPLSFLVWVLIAVPMLGAARVGTWARASRSAKRATMKPVPKGTNDGAA